MAEKRKAPGDAPRTSPPPARMRAASTDDEDVPHGGDPGSGGERKRVEGVPPRQHLPIAGMDANLTDNSGRIDSFARGDDNEPSSPSENEDELAVSEGKPQPPPPPPDQTVEEAEPPQPLPNDERMAMEDVPEPSRAENYDDCGDSPSYEWVLAATILASIRARMQRHICGEPMDGALSFIEQEEVTSSLRPMSSSEQPSPSGSEEQLASAAAARALASRAADHHVNQPAEAEAQPLPSDNESIASAEMVVPAPAVEDSDHLGSP